MPTSKWNNAMATTHNDIEPKGERTIKQNLSRLLVKMLTWLGAAIVYYMVFSLLFDTPAEYALRHSTDRLREEYERLEGQYDTLNTVLDNVIARDRNIFGILFKSEPYDFNSEYEQQRLELHERLLDKSKRKMTRDATNATERLEARLCELDSTYTQIRNKLDSLGEERDNIPAIQPVNNHQLTLLTASYGTLMHPFYRTLHSHQGVDFTIPEGSRIFATADGVVSEVSGRHSTSGLTVVINHGNGYTTSYSHLGSTKMKKGMHVNRGDIIAISGNSGLSLSPHLHYEVRYEGMRVDPIHYFFMELTPEEYQRIIRIAQSGMQSFD